MPLLSPANFKRVHLASSRSPPNLKFDRRLLLCMERPRTSVRLFGVRRGHGIEYYLVIARVLPERVQGRRRRAQLGEPRAHSRSPGSYKDIAL
uniref:Uncharacterized protein n=1 Tax=Arundo donax TaxID=35708 RepID=A0A0A9B1D6_ARUDO